MWKKKRTLETEACTYMIFSFHLDFVKYINRTIAGKHLDVIKCVPAITEIKPPHRIFLDLECNIDCFQQNEYWRNLCDRQKDDMIIDFLITNINHESQHKAIFEIPEISSLLKKCSYLLKDIDYERMEYIVAEMELELD
jgi:hypothetical protein